MDFLPVFLNVKNQRCLVVGGGAVALRKISLLLEAGAAIHVVAPALIDALESLLQQQKITHDAHSFESRHLDGCMLVIAATNDSEINRNVYESACARNIPVNVVDSPELCTFIMPAIVDRSPLMIAISSGGHAPVLARLLRARLETLIPHAYARLAAYAAKFRPLVKQRFSYKKNRRLFWEKALQGRFAEMVLSGKDKAAQACLRQLLENERDHAPRGEVYLVGAGPGNPDLLTFRAMRLMQQADVVVYDRLVSPAILDLVRRDAARIYAGKERNRHTLTQESINQLLVRLAQEGKRVLRLKGGDPFIFGRGGEEIETLAGHQIPFQVVPGITAASGVAAFAGIPLTHRDYAQSCIFVTGHLKNNSLDLDWPSLARPNQTVVIYMGLLGLPVLCKELIAHGCPPGTSAVIIQQGTMQTQKIVIGTLETLPDLTADAQLAAPTLIIVGEVVRLHRKLSWFEPEDNH
ncbi:uroporphyrin-III C-methyltransferase / precorrin-2 dehydrogenase / sirohydrochlorin ferrochelatase [Nitrosomonas sp. Nm51]|uniref:siroheme synthase CysG n=1 Tax=Nitrosomonas sp. Nm51 TaxID=133720 RepID=UPI0008BB4CB4|nr:siroheme synthase CysG [Nitrosomonas sp. Nm51]SEQ99647.1 uroporphyrin-III C-methyltransferase / precorrin-2 dehydrogenase / sirohydrochlorin ferrochelatase [Nitrosomonas sp. Nm51]